MYYVFVIGVMVAVLPGKSVSSTSSSSSAKTSGYAIGTENPGYNTRWAKRRRTYTANENSGDASASSDTVEFANKIEEEHAELGSEETMLSTHKTEFVAECSMPTDVGMFRMRSYRYVSEIQKLEPIVLSPGESTFGTENVWVRVHDQCLTSEVFGSSRCDCRDQLQESLRVVIQENDGVIIYLQQEGRGIGIANKIAAYALQDDGMDTVDANEHLGFKDELREYKMIPDILKSLGIKSIKLVTNNPYKMEQLGNLGVNITGRIPIEIKSNPHNRRYLLSKRDRMRHLLSDDSIGPDQAFLKYPLEDHIMNPKEMQGMGGMVNSSSLCDEVATVTATTAIATTTATASDDDKSALQSILDNRNTSYIFGRSSVEAAIEAVRTGKVVIVVDDENRENEGM